MYGIRDALMVIAISAVIGLITYTVILNKRLDAALAQAESANAIVKGYAARDKAGNALRIEREKTNNEVRNDLSKHPEWADQPVPDDLAQRLRKH